MRITITNTSDFDVILKPYRSFEFESIVLLVGESVSYEPITQAALDYYTMVSTATGVTLETEGDVDEEPETPVGGGVSDHGQLTGLTDDDHTQYLNTTRGDARYALTDHTHPSSGDVSSVNGQTGEVVISAEELGALTESSADLLYAPLTHDHDSDYAPLTHNHDSDYAPLTHDHDSDYAPLTHNHDSDYAPIAVQTEVETARGEEESLNDRLDTIEGQLGGGSSPATEDFFIMVSPDGNDNNFEVTQTQLSGTVSIYGDEFIVGDGTSFTTELSAGDYVYAFGKLRKIASVTDNTNATATVAFDSGGGGATIYKITGMMHTPQAAVDKMRANAETSAFRRVITSAPADYNQNVVISGFKGTGVVEFNGGYSEGSDAGDYYRINTLIIEDNDAPIEVRSICTTAGTVQDGYPCTAIIRSTRGYVRFFNNTVDPDDANSSGVMVRACRAAITSNVFLMNDAGSTRYAVISNECAHVNHAYNAGDLHSGSVLELYAINGGFAVHESNYYSGGLGTNSGTGAIWVP
jgi:hypothetical protein